MQFKYQDISVLHKTDRIKLHCNKEDIFRVKKNGPEGTKKGEELWNS